MKLFEEKLGELDPGFGVELMILAAPEVEAWSGTQDALPEAGADRRLAGRGRHDRSRRPAGAAAGRGERGAAAAARQPPARARADDGAVSAKPAPAGAWARVAAMKGARPTRLLQRPEPVDVTAFVPDDPPSVFHWRRHAHRIVRAEGPERMADEWWRPRPDGSRPPANIVPPFRDYYRVEDDDGGRFWLFRDGPYRRAANGRPTARWFLHGFCA